MLEVAWYWNQSLVNIKLVGASVAASTERHNIPAIVIAVYFLNMSTDQIPSATLVTVCGRTSTCGFTAFSFPIVQPSVITCRT